MKLPFNLLCDENKEVIRLYHLLNPHEHGGISYTAVFIIKKSAVIGFRSLDRTANRVQMNAVISYLDQLAKDPDYLSQPTTFKNKENITPSTSAGVLIQIGRNMLMRGNWEDWKHYIYYPWKIVKSMVRKKPTS